MNDVENAEALVQWKPGFDFSRNVTVANSDDYWQTWNISDAPAKRN